MNASEEERKKLLATQEKPKKWYHHWVLLTLLGAGVIAFFAWPKAKSHYQRWNADRQVRQAADFLAKGDIEHALLGAKNVLNADPVNIGATRIAATALEKAGSATAAAVWRSRLDSLQPGNVENMLAWAEDSLKAGEYAATERILGMVKPEGQNNASYHATAAGVATAKGDTASAELHWTEASRLKPEEDSYRFPMAASRLKSAKPEVRASGISALTELSKKPDQRLKALRVLLLDAIECKTWARAGELADALETTPGATFEDKLSKLTALRAMGHRESVNYLTELRDASLAKPQDLYLLLMWMNQHDLALMVAEWARTLPPEVLGVPPVCVAVADAYARSSDWKKLREAVDGRAWDEWDYLRRAFLARALERLDEAEQSAQEWTDAVSAARSRPRSQEGMERLAKVAISWKWDVRAEEVSWMLAGSPGCPRWVLDGLWRMNLDRADTAQLQKLAGMLAQADPKSADLRTRYAFFSLLVHSEDGNPDRKAEKLFNENPRNAAIAVTRGLSLFQQGKFAEALAVTAALPPEELQKPDVALYHAIFLTANGESGKAAGFLAAAQQKRKMFAEEKALLERAKLTVAKAAGEQDVAEAAKAARAARAAQAAEADAAVEAARAARAAKAAEPPKDAEEKEIAAAVKARMAERAARTAEADAAVEAARAARAAKAAEDAAKPPSAAK